MAEFFEVTSSNLRVLSQDTHQQLIRLREWGFIPNEGDYKCSRCGLPYTLQKDASRIDGYIWRCSNTISKRKQKRARCGQTVSFRQGTFFANSHLQIWQILAFVHMWVNKVSLSFIALDLKMNYKTAVDWASFCREVLLNEYTLNPMKLGGPGRIVEIDESKFGRRKYHRGHRVEGQWVFGGYERGTGRVFMVPVEDRGANTLVPVIEKWIEKGTTIISDYWKAYDCLEAKEYIQLKVNHSIHFKDLETGAHTNSIESSWRHAKASMSSSGRRKHHLPGNLARYMFNKVCIETKEVCLATKFFKLAAALYNPMQERSLVRDPVENLDEYDSDT